MAEMMTGGARCHGNKSACFRGRSMGRPKPAVSRQGLTRVCDDWQGDDDRANLVLRATGLSHELGRPKYFNSDTRLAEVVLDAISGMVVRLKTGRSARSYFAVLPTLNTRHSKAHEPWRKEMS